MFLCTIKSLHNHQLVAFHKSAPSKTNSHLPVPSGSTLTVNIWIIQVHDYTFSRHIQNSWRGHASQMSTSDMVALECFVVHRNRYADRPVYHYKNSKVIRQTTNPLKDGAFRPQRAWMVMRHIIQSADTIRYNAKKSVKCLHYNWSINMLFTKIF